MKVFIIMTHNLLDVQINELQQRMNVNEIIYLPEKLKKDFMQISNSNTKNIKLINEIKSFININKTKGDYVLVQGEYGITNYIVNWCFKNELIPIYDAKERAYNEEDLENGSVPNKNIFNYIKFEKYIEPSIVDKIYDNFKSNNLMKVIELLYLAKVNEIELTKEEQEAINEITKNLYNIFDENKIDIYLSEINYCYNKAINKTKLGHFMALELWNIIESENINVNENVRFILCDRIATGYNHLGDIDNANNFFSKCRSLRHSVCASQYMETMNRYAVNDTNEFNFTLVIRGLAGFVDDIKSWEDMDYELVEKLKLNKEREKVLSLRGKIYSSIGQNYAYLGDKINSLKYFNKALEHLTGIYRSITLSYLLHLAIDQGDVNLYENYIKEYIPGETVYEQFDNLLNSKDSYKAYVFTKAIDKFYYDRLDNDFIKKIIYSDYKNYGFDVAGNPWQLIYKHMAFILYKKNKIDNANEIIKKIEDVSFIKKLNKADEVTIKLINANTLLKAYEFNKNEMWKEKALQDIEYICNSRETLKIVFKDALILDDEDEKMKLFKEKFRFMFD